MHLRTRPWRPGNSLLMGAMLLFAGQAVAVPVSASLDYTCVFPLIEEQPLNVEIRSDMPEAVAVGGGTDAFDIDATAHVSAQSWNGLSFVGTTTVAGTVSAQAMFSTPALDLPLVIPMDITREALPAEASTFDVAASGSTPPLTLNNPGTVDIRVGDLVMMLAPEDSNGNPTGLGDFESECTLVAGQQAVLHTFEVTDGSEGNQAFAFAGQGQINDRVALPLSGQMTVAVEPGSNTVSGQMQANPASISVSIIRFFKTLSLDADVTFLPQGTLSGSFSNGRLALEQEISAELDNVHLKVFGFPLSQGQSDSCKTAAPIPLAFSSPDGESFDMETGGHLAGTFSMPSFTGCGAMTELVNLFLTGPDNTFSIMLTPES